MHSKNSLGLWGPPLDIDAAGRPHRSRASTPPPSVRTRPTACSPTRATRATSWSRRRSPTRTPAARLQNTVTDAEAFLDPTRPTRPPAPASSSSPSTASSTRRREPVYGLIPLSQVKALADGTHQVFVRGQDAAGNWGVPLFACRPGRRQDGPGARER